MLEYRSAYYKHQQAGSKRHNEQVRMESGLVEDVAPYAKDRRHWIKVVNPDKPFRHGFDGDEHRGHEKPRHDYQAHYPLKIAKEKVQPGIEIPDSHSQPRN